VYARGVEDRFTISIDSSGELLHRRGWRTEGAQAPLRETLAAALLLACRWDPSTPFVDPMCGAGTLPLEACALALGRAPGLGRSFAFERWPGFDAAAWAELRDEAARAERRAPEAAVCGSDRSPAAVAAARRNAERAGLAEHLRLVESELADVQPPDGTGLVLCNPPYGRRIGEPRALGPLYARLGKLLKARFAGWRAGVLVADLRQIAALKLEPVEKTALVNGGVRVHLVQFQLPSKPARR
jgi:putative N6-adenine-specific DNA methylase